MAESTLEELEEDGFKIKPESTKPVKKPVVETPVIEKVTKSVVPEPIPPVPQPAQPPAQIVYVDNRELVKELKAHNETLESKIEDLVEAVNHKPKSFKLDIQRDERGRMDTVIVDIKQ